MQRRQCAPSNGGIKEEEEEEEDIILGEKRPSRQGMAEQATFPKKPKPLAVAPREASEASPPSARLVASPSLFYRA